MNTEKFQLWCVVELFGHQKIAGLCTEQNIAGTNMLRVDVPETEKIPAFTRFLGSSAIYAINPVDELTARHYAQSLQVQPINAWDISAIVSKNREKLLLDTAPRPQLEENEDEDNEFEENGPSDDELKF
jgi:hypothetical protein